MKYFSLSKRKEGYSLLELVISISIFVIISTIVMNNFRQGQKMDDLRTGAIEFANNFREVQTLGMSGQVVNVCNGGDNDLSSCSTDLDCPNGGTCGLVPIGGFGISIGKVYDTSVWKYCYETGSTIDCPTTYTLFADLSGTAGKFDVGGGDIPLAGKNNYALPKNVRIRDYIVTCSWQDSPGFTVCPNATPFGIDISFRPPKPTPYFFTPIPPKPKTFAEQTIRIMLEHKSTGKCRMVMINGVSGEISEIADFGSDCNIFPLE
ncbi:MAG: prepilin-type N-terminal cleavage/methylation domain-containing protein [Patescibacteria group bacterium]